MLRIPPDSSSNTHKAGKTPVTVLALFITALSISALAASADGIPKEELTGSYLEGSWCSVYGGQETTEWAFDAEGSYRIGVPAGSGYAMQPEVRSLEHFRERFESVVEMEPDTFTTLHRHGRKNVFTRGQCQ